VLILNGLYDGTRIMKNVPREELICPELAVATWRQLPVLCTGNVQSKGRDSKNKKRQSRDWRSRACGAKLPGKQYMP